MGTLVARNWDATMLSTTPQYSTLHPPPQLATAATCNSSAYVAGPPPRPLQVSGDLLVCTQAKKNLKNGLSTLLTARDGAETHIRKASPSWRSSTCGKRCTCTSRSPYGVNVGSEPVDDSGKWPRRRVASPLPRIGCGVAQAVHSTTRLHFSLVSPPFFRNCSSEAPESVNQYYKLTKLNELSRLMEPQAERGAATLLNVSSRGFRSREFFPACIVKTRQRKN